MSCNMKILWFVNSPCGSVRRYNVKTTVGGWLISLEDELKKQEYIQLEVAYFSDKKEDTFVYDGVKYYPMGESRSDNPIKRIMDRRHSTSEIDTKRLPCLKRVVDESNPDIIHIHGTEECFGIVAPYAKAKGIPVVYSIQGMIAPISEFYFRGLPKHDAFNLDSWLDRFKNVGIRNNWKSFQERAERERKFLSQADYIFGRTFWDRDCTLALNPKRKYMVVNEMLRPEFYVKQWKGTISNGKINIVSTISGGIYKGMETALKAAALLKQYGNIDFEWRVAGYDSSSKWVRIAEHVSGIRCKDCNITLLGRLDAGQLSDLLCQSDMYIHVSHIENSPNSVCEAMLIGIPVIASFAGGTASLLENGKEGVLYQDGDPYVLAGAILENTKFPEMARAYARNAFQRAKQRHAPSSIIEDLLCGYNEIIQSNRR